MALTKSALSRFAFVFAKHFIRTLWNRFHYGLPQWYDVLLISALRSLSPTWRFLVGGSYHKSRHTYGQQCCHFLVGYKLAAATAYLTLGELIVASVCVPCIH
jgi:hypothetical protein